VKVIQNVRRLLDLHLIICNWDKASSQKLVDPKNTAKRRATDPTGW